MGNIGILEMILMIPGCVLGFGGVVGIALGIVAFFRVKKLEQRVRQLEDQKHADTTA